jgi:anti-sigma B factor antagonist
MSRRLPRLLPAGAATAARAIGAPASPPTVTLTGELDISSAAWAQAALERGQRNAASLIVDMRQVTFIDCAGLAPLVRALRRALEQGGGITVLASGATVPRLLRLTGLRGWFTVLDDDTVSDAP